MKKIILFILVFSFLGNQASFGGEDVLEVGFLARLRTSEEEFYNIVKNSWSTKGWTILGGNHSVDAARFYDSLILMQMALNSGEIDEMVLPEFVSEYLLRVNDNYEPCCISNSGSMGLCFGFLDSKKELAFRWNETLRMIRNNWTLMRLIQEYITNSEINYGDYDNKKNKTVRFEHFKDAPTVKVAVTGDLPPLDYIGEDGMPSGFNIALLAEIGKRLKINIETVSLNSRARTSALVSGRADVVFWFEVDKSMQTQLDVPEGVILSDPYYEWNKFIHLRLKKK